MELPSHPEADDQAPAPSSRTGTIVVLVVVGALIAVMVILHLTGVVGPTAH
jgi:hypothetical protein